jgi:Emfourin
LKIHFEQTGGIAGIRLVADIDTNHSSFTSEAHEIQSMVNASKFFSLPSKIDTKDKSAKDYFTYKITLESDDGQKHTVETTDVSKPLELTSLIGYLRKKAQPVRRNPK